MERAKRGRTRVSRAHAPALPVDFPQVVDAGDVGAKMVLIPRVNPQAPPVGLGQHVGQQVVITMIRRLRPLQRCAGVEFRMRRGIVSAMKTGIIFLPAVIGQGLPLDLAPGNAPAVGECGEEERVHLAAFLKNVEHLIGPLVEK